MTANGEKAAGLSELFLILGEAGQITLESSLPTGEYELVAKFTATAGQVQVDVESAAVPLVRNGESLTRAAVLKNGDRLRAGDLVLNFVADGRGGILYQQAVDENATLPPAGDEVHEGKAWFLVASREMNGTRYKGMPTLG